MSASQFWFGIAFCVTRSFGKAQKLMVKVIWHGIMGLSGFIVTMSYKWKMLLILSFLKHQETAVSSE